MIYVKFGTDNKSSQMVNYKPEEEGFMELDDAYMGKRLILVKGKARELTESEIEGEYKDYVAKSATIANRFQRDELLKAADVLTQLDRWDLYTSKQKEALSAYKQALRDVPLQKGFPLEVVWPKAPKI